MIKPKLEKLGFKIFGAQAGFYFWLSHPHLRVSDKICEFMLDHDMLLTPGTAFGKDGEGFARMTYCDSLDTCKKIAARLNQISINKE